LAVVAADCLQGSLRIVVEKVSHCHLNTYEIGRIVFRKSIRANIKASRVFSVANKKSVKRTIASLFEGFNS
jgi:hypothetical protein